MPLPAAATEVVLRRGVPADAEACGRICYEAFSGIAESRGFASDFPSVEAATEVVAALLAHDGFYGVVAEQDGRVVGSNFLDERSTIAGIGPITVAPAAQGAHVGRRLMLDVLDRTKEHGYPGVRLVQASYNTRSLSLYAKLGFEVREPLAVLQGDAIDETLPGYAVRVASEGDLEACDALCVRVHGHDRSGELRDAIRQERAKVVEHGRKLTGYTTGTAFFGHSVAETNDGLKALIASAAAYGGPGILLPARNGELFRWCLDRGLRVVQLMTLMTTGLYNEPQGAFQPSILF